MYPSWVMSVLVLLSFPTRRSSDLHPLMLRGTPAAPGKGAGNPDAGQGEGRGLGGGGSGSGGDADAVVDTATARGHVRTPVTATRHKPTSALQDEIRDDGMNQGARR